MYNPIRTRSAQALILVACAMILGACSTGPKIFVNNVPNENIEGFKTYNFDSRLGTDEKDGVRSAISQFLMNATSRELEQRGYVRSENPDMLVNFDLRTKEKIQARSSSYGGRYGYRGYGGYGGYDTTVTQYTQGTLSVALIDNTVEGDDKPLAWEGIAEGRMSDKARANLEEAVNTVIGDLFARYPYFAADFVPPVQTAATN